MLDVDVRIEETEVEEIKELKEIADLMQRSNIEMKKMLQLFKRELKI